MSKLDKFYPLIEKEDLVKYAKLFQRELLAALHNQRSSLPVILNPIYKLKPKPGFGVAVSIGGTNGYASFFRISQKGVIRFHNRKIFSIPQKATKNELFQIITKNILSVIDKKLKTFSLGMGVAYPLKPILVNNSLDGELLYMTKGRDIRGLVGKKIGEEFRMFLQKKYKIEAAVSVANDAICLLLGGDGVEVAGVVGTGMNFAYWEKRLSIAPLKLSELPGFFQNEVAVNTEAGNFDKIKGTQLQEAVDKKSRRTGYSLAEKEAAGAFLYQIFNAGKDEIIGREFPDLISTDQLNDIITGAYEYPRGIEISDKKKVISFAERIFHRSAQIVAIELCGILMKLGKTKGVVSIVMDGGVFWKTKNYPALVNLYINMILPEVISSFARLFGSSRRGIAILANSIF